MLVKQAHYCILLQVLLFFAKSRPKPLKHGVYIFQCLSKIWPSERGKKKKGCTSFACGAHPLLNKIFLGEKFNLQIGCLGQNIHFQSFYTHEFKNTCSRQKNVLATTILRIVYRSFDFSATSASSTNNSCFAIFYVLPLRLCTTTV